MIQARPTATPIQAPFPSPRVELPEVLVTAVKTQRAILFLGAGASREGKDSEGHSTPAADELRTMLCQKFLGRDLEGYSLMTAAEMLYAQVGITKVLEYVGEILRKFEPGASHKILPTFRWKMIATTNYDLLVERAYTAVKKDRVQTLLPFLRNNVITSPLKKENNRTQTA